MEIHRPKGLGGWRRLYLEILSSARFSSILEVGAGSPDFLATFPFSMHRIAIDGGERFKEEYTTAGIEFHKIDLDNDSFPQLEPVDVAICSDVFEHLLWPERTLEFISTTLSNDGILLSHVPNEFVLMRTVKVMLGLEEAVYFHHHCEEWNNPHLRRFTNKGFRRFLEHEFPYNFYITHLRSGYLLRTLASNGLRLPFALQMGPTYISTKSRYIAAHLQTFIKDFTWKRSITLDLGSRCHK